MADEAPSSKGTSPETPSTDAAIARLQAVAEGLAKTSPVIAAASTSIAGLYAGLGAPMTTAVEALIARPPPSGPSDAMSAMTKRMIEDLQASVDRAIGTKTP